MILVSWMPSKLHTRRTSGQRAGHVPQHALRVVTANGLLIAAAVRFAETETPARITTN